MATFPPQELAFADTAPIVAEGSGIVEGTPDEIWAVVTDYPSWPSWFGNLKSCTATSVPPTGVGSTRRVVLKGGATFDERFIAWDEGRVWAFTGIAGPPIFDGLVERLTIEPLDATRTTVTYRMAIKPKALLGPVIKLARPGIEKNLTKAMAGLDAEVARRRTAG